MDEFCGSSFWDLTLTWKTSSPQFTACFEQTVLVWLPTGFLLFFSPLDLWYSSRNHKLPLPWTSPLTLGKGFLTLVLIVLEVLAAFWATTVLEVSQDVNTQARVVQALAYVFFLVLLFYSRKRGVQSSGVQTIFWFILAFCRGIKFLAVIQDAVDVETETAVTGFVLDVIYFPVIIAQFVLHLFADPGINQDPIISIKNRKKISPEANVSFVSKILFHWFTPLVYLGFRKPLEYSDLWDLNEEDTSRAVVKTFDSKYEKDLSKAIVPESVQKRARFGKSHLEITPRYDTVKPKVNSSSGSSDPNMGSSGQQKKDVHVFWALMKAYGGLFVVGTAFRIIPDLLVFVSPQVLTLLIAFVQSGATKEPLWKGLLYAAILFLAAFCGTLLLAQATHRFYICGMRARTALVSAIYRKALLLSNSAKRETTLGEIVNLMAVDVQRGTEFVQFIYIFWSAPLQIGLALYFLWGILGPSSVAGLVVMILILPINAFIATKIKNLQTIQMRNKDERVKLMNEILSGIKVLKFYAWETCFEDKVMAIRKMELDVMRQTAVWNAITNVIWQSAPFLVAISTFGTYVLVDPSNVLDATKTFVSLSLFNIMSTPLTFLPLIIINMVQAGVAFTRIDRYLNSDEIDMNVVSHDEKEVHPIVIENGTFVWDSGEPTLRNINMKINHKALVGVVGGVGSGKSTLLSAMLGELEKVEGRVNTKGRIAYVTQQAWIQNATLRDNILFGKPYDPVLYNRVLDACALVPDLEILPARDATEIGEKGINLSGGQKQRVALARATYADADLYLFDDPLSAVDAHVGKHIFEKLIGPGGILRKKTRILVTHGIIYLPQMDHIYVMKEGQITHSGTYRTLLNEKGDFATFLKAHITSEDVEELEAADLIEDLRGVMSEDELMSLKERRASHSGAEELQVSTEKGPAQGRHRKKTVSRPEELEKLTASIEEIKLRTSAGEGAIGNKLIEAEHSEKDSVKVSVYLDYFKAAGLAFSIGTFCLYLSFQVFAVGGNLWLSEWSNQPNETFAETKYFYLEIYSGFGIFQMLSILGGSIVMAYGTVHSASGLHFSMLRRIMQAPMSFFDTTPIGRIVNRFAKDVDIIDSILPLFIRFWLNGIFSVSATLVVISYSTPIFVAVIVPIMVFYYLVQRFYVASSRQLKRLESVTRSPIYSHFGETISGASTIRAYRQQERFVRDSENKVDHNQISYFASIVANRWLAVRLETIGNVVVLFAALFAVLGRDTLDAGIVGLSVSYALQITLSLLMLVRFTSDVETNIVAVERLNEYSNAPQEAPFEISSRKPPISWPENGQVEFTAYQTRYRPGLDLVLRNVTCTIDPGEKIGIVGRTGAGKSSLTLALFRIIEAAGGKITIDGRDISKLGLHDIRGRIAIIPQDPVLFSGSLRINLDPFESFSDETIWRTLDLAHLKNFVQTLPAGLEHEISEGGENLSVGQRQLICLARALLRKTKILVLDEATAAVDLDTDDLIQQTIRKEFKDSTVITIAHRLNTILDSTRVIVLDKGEIQEFDTPQNLLNNPDSLFSGMAKDAGI